MTDPGKRRNAIVAQRARDGIGRPLVRAAAKLAVVALLAGCYPRYDWRDYRPDCARAWCRFVVSFPAKATSATRDVAVGTMQLPLTIHVASAGDLRFAVAAFDLLPGADAAEARTLLEHKLLDDVGAADAARGRATTYASDHAALEADTFEAHGTAGGRSWATRARFVERDRHLVEILVIGPADTLATATGRQAVETFFTSLRLD